MVAACTVVGVDWDRAPLFRCSLSEDFAPKLRGCPPPTLLQVSPSAEDGGGGTFEAILVLPPPAPAPPPLVVMPHGGPHSVVTASFNPQVAYLTAAGYATLIVNYRGSSGFGADALESLPGKVGTQDVADVIAAIDAAARHVDVDRIHVAGGSHGGFLACHLVLRDARIKAAAIRNPVTNVAAMWGISDIPDWTIVEACGVDADPRATPTAEQLAKMWAVSPIARPLVGGQPGRVVPPCLFLLGMKDRRVPPSQGLHFAAALRQAGSAARIRSYPDDCHPLETVGTEMDAWVQSLLLFEEAANTETQSL